MRKVLTGLVIAMPFAFGVAIAAADGGGDGGQGPGGSWQNTPHAIVVGKVVSTDPAHGTFVADAFVAGGCPTPTGSTDNTGNTGITGNTGSGDDQGDNSQGDDDNQGGDDQGSMCEPGDGDHGFGGQGFGGQGFGGGDGGGGGFGDDFRHDVNSPPASALTQVTITTDTNTKLFVNGQPGTVGDMTAGDVFKAVFNGSPSDSIQTLVQNPALAVFDRTPPPQKQIYAFVGTVTNVTSTDANDGTVTITVERSLPASLAANGSSASMTVSSDTLILGGSGGSLFGGTLSDISTGDIVVGALTRPTGETLAQVEATPLRVLLDLPVAASTSMTKTQKATAREKALKRALTLLGAKHATKAHKRSHKRAHRNKHHSRKHAHR